MCIKLRFFGVAADPGQFRVESSTTSIITGKDVVFSQRTILPYGTNLFYNPIPWEMLRTYEEKPQFLVTVDEQPVACHNMTCDYTYVKPVGEITGITYDDTSRKLVITGVDLPTLQLDGSSPADAAASNTTASSNSTATTTSSNSTAADNSTTTTTGGGRRLLSYLRKLTSDSTTDNSTATSSNSTDNSTTAANNSTTIPSSSNVTLTISN